MGYPNFGKVKTIVLPFVSNSKEGNTVFTIDEYKKETGIDLGNFIVLQKNGTTIYFDTKALILATCLPSFLKAIAYDDAEQTSYASIASVSVNEYESGVSDGRLDINFKGLCGSGFFGDVTMRFRVPKEKPFEINSIDITLIEN